MYSTRYFKTRNLEIFRLSKEMFGDRVGILTIVDFRRKSTIGDFPYLKGIEDEDTFEKENFIKAILLMDYKLDKDTKEDVIGVAEGFWGEKNCSWNIDFIKVDFSIDHKGLEKIKNCLFSFLLFSFGFLIWKYKILITNDIPINISFKEFIATISLIYIYTIITYFYIAYIF